MKNRKAWFAAFCSIFALCVSSCKQGTQVEIYTVSKNEAYKLPSNWKQTQNTSAMRLATFEVTGENQETAEVAILPMPDLKVEDHEIVNLWRSQLKLSPISKEEVNQSSELIKIGQFDGRIFDLTASEETPGEMAGMRIITAFVNSPVGTWFFKMTGGDQHLEKEKAAFTTFLGSVNLSKMQQEITAARQASDPHGGMNMANKGPMPTAPTSASKSSSSPNLPEWQIPAGWTSSGPSSMILASFKASGEGGEAKITVSSLGGAAGGLMPNINRWRRQVGLGAADQSELESITSDINIGGVEGKLVSIPGDTQGIDAAIIPHKGQTWFFKVMGPAVAVQRESENFKTFVQSLQFN